MTVTIFKTPGHLDLRAVSTFGLNAKPGNKSPIGYFGTGLKMAIAVLVRSGVDVVISVGSKSYVFYTATKEFRGEPKRFIRMKRRDGLLKSWHYESLPYTTDLAKNWELWMAYRELESNTIDEGGTTEVHRSGVFDGLEYAPKDETWIIVEGDDFAALHETARGTIFLPDALRQPTAETPKFQIFESPSDFVYYRGMRVMELEKRSIFTYNILDQKQLTEDRTLRDQWSLQYDLANFLVSHTDRAVINRYLNADENSWEYDLPFDYAHSPSQEFLDVIARRKKKTAESLALAADGMSKDRGLWSTDRVNTLYGRFVRVAKRPLSEAFGRWVEWRGLDLSSDEAALLEEVRVAVGDTETVGNYEF